MVPASLKPYLPLFTRAIPKGLTTRTRTKTTTTTSTTTTTTTTHSKIHQVKLLSIN